MADKKGFTVHFYTARLIEADEPVLMADWLSRLVAAGGAPVIRLQATDYEIRDLNESSTKAVYQGVFAKIRTDDAPHIRAGDGGERDIEMGRDEGLIEKNHFLFYRRYNLLVFQANGHGSRVGRVQDYFSALLGGQAFFDPVLQEESMQRLLADTDHSVKTELTFSKPTNTDWYPDHDFSKELMAMMNSGGAESVTMTFSARRPYEKRGFLNEAIRPAIRELINYGDVRKAKVYFESDHGDWHDIDLIADRITAYIVVKMDGRYPNSRAMYGALREAYSEHDEQFAAIFGARENNRIR